MEITVFDREMIPIGIIESITSFIWTRRYWDVGEFKLLVPYTKNHIKLLVKNNLLMKRKDTEVAEIRYIRISKNIDGLEEIEVQGKFLTNWIGKRIVQNQIITKDTAKNIIKRIVKENVISPLELNRKIPNIFLNNDVITNDGILDYTSEPYINALLCITDAAKASKVGIRMISDERTAKHYFSVYSGRNLTSEQTENPPCIFSQEFDNVNQQQFTNSIENLKTTAFVGGEEVIPRKVIKVNEQYTGIDREEIFINATDIVQTYTNEQNEQITLSDAEYLSQLKARGVAELGQHGEVLNFTSEINPYANLKYKEDYDLGDRVTCINRAWGVNINVRITEVIETYDQNAESLQITFGESIPSLFSTIRKLAK